MFKYLDNLSGELYNGGGAVVYVIQAIKGGDLCVYCQQPIKPGTVFILKKITFKGGMCGMFFAHLECNAMARGAKPEKLGLPGPRRCDS